MKYRLHKKSLINKIYNCIKSNFLRKVRILMFVQFIKYFIIQIMHKFNEIKAMKKDFILLQSVYNSFNFFNFVLYKASPPCKKHKNLV